MNLTLNKYQKRPTLDSEGSAWVQRCYVCDKGINFQKDPSGWKWLRVDELVRHRHCYPEPIR
jgi:hypothetical protein